MKNEREDIRPAPNTERKACGEAAKTTDIKTRYLTWYRCITQTNQGFSAVPLGRYAPPSRGWLVVMEGSNHGHGCVRSRAYDLKTGTAFGHSDCACEQEETLFCPTVNHLPGAARYFVGQVKVAPLQETLWMLLQLNHLQPNVRADAFDMPLPAHVERRQLPGGNWTAGGFGLGAGGSSHYRLLRWAWFVNGKELRGGEIKFDGYNTDGQIYAKSLLQLAESSLHAACPKARMPQFWSATKKASLAAPSLTNFVKRMNDHMNKVCPKIVQPNE